MNIDTTVADEATAYLESVTPDRPTTPAVEPGGGDEPDRGECLRCYVDRMVASRGCDTSLRFTSRWLYNASLAGPRRLLQWFESSGGYCDCEVLMNVLTDHWPTRVGEPEP